METNFAYICERSCALMEDDDMFMTGTDIIAGVDPSAMLGNLHREGLVITDRLWTAEDFTDGQWLIEQYHIEEAYTQVKDISQNSSSSLQYELFGNNLDLHCRPKINSAFQNYKKDSTKKAQFCLAPAEKQKSIKRCFDFLKRMHIDSRERSVWEANRGLVEDSYASTHRIAERNRRIKLSQQFLALRSLVPHNPKKVDKMSTLTNAIKELNRQKLRIQELERLNQSLSNALRGNSVSEGCSSLSYECAEDSRRDESRQCICEEVDVLVEETSIPDESIIKVTLKEIASNCSRMDAIATVEKCLRGMNLEVVRIKWSPYCLEGTIRSKRKGGRWQAKKGKKIKAAVKRALTAS